MNDNVTDSVRIGAYAPRIIPCKPVKRGEGLPRPLVVKIYAVALAALVLLWGLSWFWALHERNQIIRSQGVNMRVLAQAVAEQVQGLLQLAEITLDAGQAEMRRKTIDETVDSPVLAALTDNLRRTTQGVMLLRIVDREGNVLIPGEGLVNAGVKVDKTKFFQWMHASGSNGIYIGQPLQGYPFKRWFLPVLKSPSLSEQGVFMAVAIDLRNLADLHEDLRISPNGDIAIRSNDGTVMSNSPYDEALIGKRLTAMTEASGEYFLDGQEAVIASTKSLFAVPRLTASASLPGYGLQVSVSATLTDALASWRRGVCVIGFGLLLVSGLLLMAAHMIVRSRLRWYDSQRRFMDFAEAASDLMWEMDADLRFTFMSHRHRELTGLELQDILGQTACKLEWQPVSGNDGRCYAQALETRSGFADILFQQNRRGLPPKTLLASGIPLRNDRGVFLGYRGVVADVTEQVEREKERRIREEWEIQRSKMEALGQLASGVAHDFNNLLGAILGFAQFIVEDAENGSSQRNFADRIVQSARRGRDLVHQILAFTRRTPGDRETLSLAETIRENVDLLRVTFPTNTLLSFTPPPYDAQVFANRSQLEQVIANLCINANDALQGRDGHIAVSMELSDMDRPELRRLPKVPFPPTPCAHLQWQSQDGGWRLATGGVVSEKYVSIRIRDDGAGMDTATLSSIFTLFFTTKSDMGGTGLGLSVVERIVTDHGGAIIVRSQMGAGTEFEILLPRVETDLPEPSIIKEAIENTAAQSKRATIMVVDDNTDFCDMMQTALTRNGHEVVAANDPVEALAAIREEPNLWHVLVTDQTMPGMKGGDLIQAAKQAAPGLIAIICTGYSSSMDEAKALAIGADAFCTKPLNVNDITALVAKLLHQSD